MPILNVLLIYINDRKLTNNVVRISQHQMRATKEEGWCPPLYLQSISLKQYFKRNHKGCKSFKHFLICWLIYYTFLVLNCFKFNVFIFVIEYKSLTALEKAYHILVSLLHACTNTTHTYIWKEAVLIMYWFISESHLPVELILILKLTIIGLISFNSHWYWQIEMQLLSIM